MILYYVPVTTRNSNQTGLQTESSDLFLSRTSYDEGAGIA
jgi:hypothetical protein